MENSTIIVNNIAIEKSAINQFIAQNRKIEAVKFICEKAHIDLASSKKIVELLLENTPDYFDGKDIYREISVSMARKEINNSPKPRKNFVIIGVILLLIILFIMYIASNLTTGFCRGSVDQCIVDSTIVEDILPVEELYTYDTNRVTPQVKEQELLKIKNARFDTLKLAKNPPNDEDARVALIGFTRGRLTDVIIDQKLNIAVGRCYENSNTEGNYRCVSCMVMLYNRVTNKWQEAPEGDNFLKTAYDFYLPSEGDYWEAKDLSIMIPFDYKLFKSKE